MTELHKWCLLLQMFKVKTKQPAVNIFRSWRAAQGFSIIPTRSLYFNRRAQTEVAIETDVCGSVLAKVNGGMMLSGESGCWLWGAYRLEGQDNK
jgi:hypothetical protein